MPSRRVFGFTSRKTSDVPSSSSVLTCNANNARMDLSRASDLTNVTLILFPLLLAVWLLWTFLKVDQEKAIDFTVEAPEQCAPGWNGKTLDEPTIKVPGSFTIQCYAPATAQSLGFVNPTTPDGIDRTIAKAAEAQVQWAKSSFVQRRRLLRTLLKFVLDNQESIARAACLDSGKTRVDAVFGEVLVTAGKLKWTIDHGEKALRTEVRPRNFLMFYKHNEVRYEPLGVVGACVSWK